MTDGTRVPHSLQLPLWSGRGTVPHRNALDVFKLDLVSVVVVVGVILMLLRQVFPQLVIHDALTPL